MKCSTRPFDASRDRKSASECICRAFADDPIVAHLDTYTTTDYEQYGVEYWDWFSWVFATSYGMTDVATRDGVNQRETVVCAALWEPASTSIMFVLRMFLMGLWLLRNLGWGYLKRTLLMLMAFEGKRHQLAPTALHLQILGTDTNAQGKGVGSELIRVGLERADSLGLHSYIESSNPRNIPFYKRHGFVVLEELYPFESDPKVVGRGPVATLMLRTCSAKKEA